MHIYMYAFSVEGRGCKAGGRGGMDREREERAQHIRRGGAPLLYRLMAVIVHHGSAGGGHFTTHRRLRVHRGGADGHHGDDERGQWVHVSDLHTQQVSAEQVLGCEAYMLFYEAV